MRESEQVDRNIHRAKLAFWPCAVLTPYIETEMPVCCSRAKFVPGVACPWVSSSRTKKAEKYGGKLARDGGSSGEELAGLEGLEGLEGGALFRRSWCG